MISRRQTTHQKDLAEAAHVADEQGRHDVADELFLLSAGDVDDEDEQATNNQAEFSGLLLSEIDEDTTDWLWRNWLELGNVSLLVGLGSVGKSTIVSDLIARVTKGDPMPDGTVCEAPGGAVVISLEEKTAATVRPRLRRAGADLARIVDLSRVPRTVVAPGDVAWSPFMLPDDLPILERAILKVNASLVVIDPLMSAVNPKVSTFRNQSARQVIGAFQEMASRLGVAVVIVNHFTKGSLKDPLTAMAGSKGFSDIVRSVLMLTGTASDPRKRVLSLIKHNNAPEVEQLVLEHNGSTVRYLSGVTVEQKRKNDAQTLSKSRQEVLAILHSQPAWEFTPTELAQRSRVHYDTMKSILRRMEADGQITRTAHGFYQEHRTEPAPLKTPTAPSKPTAPAPSAPLPVVRPRSA